MCGIVAVLTRPARRPPPDPARVVALLEGAQGPVHAAGAAALAAELDRRAALVEEADALLRGATGVVGLLSDRTAMLMMATQTDDLRGAIDGLDAALDSGAVVLADDEVEAVNAALVRLKDAVWSVRSDRLGTADAVRDLAGENPSPAAIEACWQIQVALAAIDRLEVRGRDSAGVHLLVRDHGLDLGSPSVRSLLDARTGDPLFRSGSLRTPEGHLAFVYKAAAEIGELGDNTRALRATIRDDALLHLALRSPGARTSVLAHTRWASVGLISQANAHPVASPEGEPYVTAALNGDVDNHADLKVSERIDPPGELTTDAAVIPVLVSRRLAEGASLEEAFRWTASALDGSVAVAAASAAEPGRLLLALRGSGQGLYVGLAEDAYVVASEPYGLVEQCGAYVRMDGETPARGGDPSSRGQIVVLDASEAGTVDGLHRMAYDGTELAVEPDELQAPQITTRDIAREPYPHFLLKEITEAPASFRKTLRGKLIERDGRPEVRLGAETLPQAVADRLADGRIRRVYAIGQGTAAIAAGAFAAALGSMLDGLSFAVEGLAAAELSGFKLRDDMSDSLVVAISQSGTTTDTNRTVDVAKARGASVIGIVNRRSSDLVDRADGVLYTSDGRDVEMAVPSTKAFYAQVAAGFLLACALADRLGAPAADGRSELLRALAALPEAMERVLGGRDHIAAVARAHAPSRRYWAVVGNGPNRIAAEEVRIKLSELCYKSIACDHTEDKKHIDLSAEPLILVCAAGLHGSNAEDVSKEIAIYRAHKAAPIVIASEGTRYPSALEVITVPFVHPQVDFVLSAMAGHLFGYEAALAIDAQARLLREARAAVEATMRSNGDVDRSFDNLHRAVEPVAHRFFDGIRAGAFDGHLEASTAVRLASLLRYATGVSPLDAYQIEHGKVGTPSVIVEDLTDVLTAGIDELTRPIDAIRHQAKTVTVGISRSDETLVQVPLVKAVLAAGGSRDRLAYRVLRSVAALDPAVEQVTGYTHYRVEGDDAGEATAHVLDKGGIARELTSRTERDPRLRGTKHRAATEREVMISRGHDGRTVVIVPEVKGADVTGIVLLHAQFRDRLPAPAMRSVLQGYRDRYSALRDAVTETEPTFRDDVLGEVDVADLLISPVYVLAAHWRAS